MRIAFSLVAIMLSIVGASAAAADSITLTLDAPLEGKLEASGSPTITFDDGGGTGTVTMTMSLAGLDSSEKLKSWFWNALIDPTTFDFTYVSGVEATNIQTVFNSTSQWKADGTGGYHDIKFEFDTSDGVSFDGGETSVYTITGTGITAHTFNALGIATPGDPRYSSAAHICGLPDDESTWLASTGSPVPEPASLVLVGLGASGLAFLRRRRARQARAS